MSEPRSGSGFRYRAFISYSHADKAWADWLHKALETYRVPSRLVGTRTAAGVVPRRLIPIFRDRDELASATDLGRTVNAALAGSACLLVVCSPRAARSRWVNEEVLAFARMGRSEHVFCIIVDGEPNASDQPGRESAECFCPALRHRVDEHGRPTGERIEPIAADVRPGADGKANARLKLIAGMLGVGFDQLKHREQQRRIRRMTATTALALAVMAVTVVLAALALVSRHNAVVAQQRATAARQAAERRQKQAEGLVNFMLGDLNDKLAQVQRLDIMQAVDDKAMAYFKSLPDTDVTPLALAQRAKALEKIGSVRMNRGALPKALAAFQASTRISGRLARAAPTDPARQLAYARTLSYIGLVYWEQGHLDQAQQQFESARAVLHAAQPDAADDPRLQFELQDTEDNLGHVLEARGRLQQAEAPYRRMLELCRSLVARDPHNADWNAALADAHNNLGKLALLRGDLLTAITEYRADDAIESRLSRRNPQDNDQLGNVVRGRAILGRTLALAGDMDGALRDLGQAVAIADRLVAADPQHANFQEYAALYGSQLARLQRLHGQAADARQRNTRALATIASLVHQDPSNSNFQEDYAEALTEQAAEAGTTGQRDAARRDVRQALRILAPMLASRPDDRYTLLRVVRARLLEADLAGDAHAAHALRERALATMQAQASGRHDPRLQSLQVTALLALGKSAQARSLARQLWREGCHDPSLVAALHRAGIDYPSDPAFAARLLASAQHPATQPAPADDAAATHPRQPSPPQGDHHARHASHPDRGKPDHDSHPAPSRGQR